jgi:hypothetical protein
VAGGEGAGREEEGIRVWGDGGTERAREERLVCTTRRGERNGKIPGMRSREGVTHFADAAAAAAGAGTVELPSSFCASGVE